MDDSKNGSDMITVCEALRSIEKKRKKEKRKKR